MAELRSQLAGWFSQRQRQQQLQRLQRARQRENQRLEQQPQGINQATSQLLRGLSRSIQRRSKLREQPQLSLGSWLLPRAPEQLTSHRALVLALRRATGLLLLLPLFSLVLNAVPFQLASPSWYLEVLAYIAENVPLLILIALLALLSLVLDDQQESTERYKTKLQRFSRFGYYLVLLLLPLQLGFTAWLYGQFHSTYRTQLLAIRNSAQALIVGAQGATTTDQFITYLRGRGIVDNLQSIAAAPLVQVQTEFIRSVRSQQQRQEQSLGQTTRSTLLRYSTNALKLLITLVVLAVFLRYFQTLLRGYARQEAELQIALEQPLNQAFNAPSGNEH
jgi:exonuclease VII large subunit